ncbi:MAG: hypothetical protein QXN23_06445 [Candidatus Caldarchaeum sp.]|jgi:hypothetical protein|uniref:Hsp20/alpha crystallin family protein n=1 Tax=Caldiarchaeum subterraneum TaxID=311458 RepID=A0A7C4I2L2_CALS0|nr:hypothetical protein [Candidatus Caldarchaeales archaeon]MDJ0272735.1 hypothetical protein [Candidatus Caldarchaeales archaeon]
MQQNRNQGRFSGFWILMMLLIAVAAASFFIRLSPGILGLALAAMAVLLTLYWARAVKTSLGSSAWDDYLLELRQEGDVVDVTAQVPGPETKVRVELLGRKLILIGGMGFRRTVKLPFEAMLRELRYVNGILTARLVKRTASATTG